MEAERKVNIKVGLTVLGGILVLLIGLALGKDLRFGQAQVVKALFPTAGGLEVGDPVTINGLKRGKVTAIELAGTDVMVSMEFPERIPLKRDAQASIMMFELMGGKMVELISGRSADELPHGAILQGNFTGDVSSLVAMVGSLSGTVASVAVKADTLLASLNVFFAQSNLRADVDRTLSSADRALLSVDRVVSRADQLLADNAGGIRRTLDQAEAALNDVKAMLIENRPGIRAFIDSATITMGSARSTLGNANRLLTRLDSVLSDVNNDKALLGKMLRDERFAKTLDSTLIEFRKLAEQVRKQGMDANIRLFNSSSPLP